MAPPRRRLDADLVRRGLARSRAEASELISAGRVTVGGAPATKAARLVHAGEAVLVTVGGPRFVSRAGGKLAGALDRFGITVEGRVALDVGASTGGFTDCLLQAGARRVVAVDVGRNQLHERLRGHERVLSLEQTDIRDLDGTGIGAPFELITVDLSFISLRSVLDPLLGLAAPTADLLLLVKPQFEAGRQVVARTRGVVGEPAIWRRVLSEVTDATRHRKATIIDVMVSAVPGAAGNIEFMAHAHPGTAAGITDDDLDRVVEAARVARES